MIPAGDLVVNLGLDTGIIVTRMDIKGFTTRFPCLPDALPQYKFIH
jgi:hypothetical protein